MIRRALLIAVIAVDSACGKGNSPLTSSPISGILLLTLSGPTSVAPGATIHLAVSAVRSGILSEDVTSLATWASSNPDVLRVNAGTVDGVRDGEAIVTAQYAGFSARMTLTTLEPGTYAITGTVADSGFGLAGALIDVLSGTGAGKTATADANGVFKLYGVAGVVQLQGSADGYQSSVQTVTVASPSVWVKLTLRPAVAPDNVSGTWQLTIDASPTCSTLAVIARRRTYTATITQDVSALRIQLSGATFAPDPSDFGATENTFFGRIIQDAVTLKLDSYDYYGLHYDLGELLPGTGTYTVFGAGSGAASANAISVTLAAVIGLSGPNSSACKAADHRLTFTRTDLRTGRR
jgi:hypothetical protein